MKFVEGQTRAGTSVKVAPDDNGSFGYLVEVDGKRHKLRRVNVARDGGTTTLFLDNGSKIVFPHKFNEPDRIPKLDGADIVDREEAGKSESMSYADENAKAKAIEALDASRKVLDGIEARIDDLDFLAAGKLFAHEQFLAGLGVDACRLLVATKASEN